MKKSVLKISVTFLSLLFLCQNIAFSKGLPNLLDELNPKDPNIEKILQYYDKTYYEATGKSAIIDDGVLARGSCFRNACPVWADVHKNEQMVYLYIDGVVTYIWPVSTGKRGYETPDMDLNPNGRIYDKYTSIAFPDGDYNGLGNMPYAVFLRGGYAIHGTTRGNWPILGKAASHGCVRLHPDNAFIFNRLVRNLGVGSVWVTIE